MTRCPQCHTEYTAARGFCGQCGHRMGDRCSHCSSPCLPEDIFCGVCGQRVLGALGSVDGGKSDAPLVLLLDELVAEVKADETRAAQQDGTLAQDDISALFQQGQEE